MKRASLFLGALAVLLIGAGQASASVINVLWYTGGVEVGAAGSYNTAISALSGQSLVAPISIHNTLNITFWNGTGPTPVVSNFNTLVVASPQGGWSVNPSYTALANAFTSGLTLGNRVMVTGQDADWHYTHTPGPTNFNGPQGFLIDAINWSGSGTGLGAVFLGGSDSLVTSLLGVGTQTGASGDTVNIPSAFATFPINEGLTSAGLSNWSTSEHTTWTGFDTSKWTAINVDGSGGAVTMVSAATAGGGTGGTVAPAPSGIALSCMGIFLCAGYVGFQRRKQPVAA